MATDSVSAKKTSSQRPGAPRRRNFYISGLAVRVLAALVISWLIVMIFFVTVVGSH